MKRIAKPSQGLPIRIGWDKTTGHSTLGYPLRGGGVTSSLKNLLKLKNKGKRKSKKERLFPHRGRKICEYDPL